MTLRCQPVAWLSWKRMVQLQQLAEDGRVVVDGRGVS